MLLALAIAITGLVWSFTWFENGLYYITSGGETKPGYEEHPLSDTTKAYLADTTMSPIDRAWYITMENDTDIEGMYLHPHVEGNEAVEILAYHDHGSFYDRNLYYYDQYTMEPIRVRGDRFSEAGFADQLVLLNYDIHIGAALGLTGKVIAFFVSLISASLPVTGFLVWINRKKKKKRSRSF